MSLASQLSFLESSTSTIQQINNNIVIAAGANASSTTTGALQIVNGGLAVGGSIFVGGIVTATTFVGAFAGTITGTATTATNVAAGTAGQLPYQSAPGTTAFIGPGTFGQFLMSTGASAPVYQSTLTQANGNIIITSNTAVSSTNSGALQLVNGGMGIGGGLFVGGNVSLLGNTLTTKYLTLSPNTLSTDVSSLGAYVQLGNPISNQPPDVSGIQFANYSGASTGLAAIRYNNGGANYGLELNASVVSGDKIRLTAGSTGGVIVTSPTSATSTNTGALQVVGGIGVAGGGFFGGIVTATTYYGTFAGTIGGSVTINTATNIAAGTAGQLLYQSAPGTTAFIGPGTFGQFLMSTGASAPVYQSTLTQAGGNVGIGTTAPLAKLEVSSTASTTVKVTTSGGNALFRGYEIGATTGDSGVYGSMKMEVAGGELRFTAGYSTWGGYQTFYTNGVERLRLTTNGGVAFGGSANYGSSGQVLQSNGDAAPTWVTATGITAGNATTATNIAGGTAGQLHYQTAPGLTGFAGPGTFGQFLMSTGASAPVYQSTLTQAGGNIIITSNTAATSTTTGALQVVNGGVGIGGNLYVGGEIVATKLTIQLTTVTTTLVQTDDIISTYNYTNATSTITGALQVAGGAGIGRDLWVGGNITVLGTINASITGVSTTATNIAGGTAGQLHYQTGPGATSFAGPGTAGQILVSAGTSAPTYTNTASIYVGRAVIADSASGGSATATSIAGGNAWQIPYQSAPSTTLFASSGTTGQFWQATTNGAPSWTTTASIYVNSAVNAQNMYGGAAMSIPYQSAANTTAFLAAGTAGYILSTNGTGSAPTWVAVGSVTAGTSTQIQTVAQPGNATYYPAFVSANNASATAMSVYTTSSFSINPATGNVTHSTTVSSVNTAGSHLTLAQPGASGQTTIGFTFAGSPKATIRSDGSNLIFDAFGGNFYFNNDYGVSSALPFYVGSGIAWYGYTNGIQAPSFGVGTAPSGTAGEIRATNEITAYYSDRRLKENVVVIDNAVEKVKSLNGITYTPNDVAVSFGYDKTVKLVGLFADEVEAVLPEATRPAPFDQDENGNSKSGENYKTIQYEKVVPLLVEAIKEQQKTIETLLSELENIKKQLGK